MTRREDQIQRGMVEFLETCVPPPPEGPWWTACNPAPSKTLATAGRSKMLGMKAGTPDLIFCIRGRFVGIEVKPPSRYLSKVQKQVHSDIALCGGRVYTVHSLSQLEEHLKVLGVPMRGRVAA